MPIVILSPYSGRSVKIRDKDIGRSVRDEESRIFYVVPRSDGKGYYSSITRNGSPKDESRYLELEKKDAVVDVQKREELAKPIHDAMGKTRKSTLGRRIVLLLILIGLAYVAWTQKDRFLESSNDATRSPANQLDAPQVDEPGNAQPVKQIEMEK